MAKTTGLSLRTVQRIWEAHGLQLHRVRSFKRSREADFVSKTEDIVAPSRPGAMPLGCRNIPGGHGRNWTAQVSIANSLRLTSSGNPDLASSPVHQHGRAQMRTVRHPG
jgi:hypothetical protein